LRRRRVRVPGVPHHVTQRGNRRSEIFLDAEDRHLYLELLREYSTRHRLRLWAYSLMTNHTHLIVLPEGAASLSSALRDTHSTYASMFNRKYGFTGHLWQGRFYACVLDAQHLEHAVRYVECNPVRAGMVDRAEHYPWSSARPHFGRIEDRYLDDGLPLVGAIDDWSGEHEVSLLSAASILNAIDQKKFDVVPIGITKEGKWVSSGHAEKLLAARPGAD